MLAFARQSAYPWLAVPRAVTAAPGLFYCTPILTHNPQTITPSAYCQRSPLAAKSCSTGVPLLTLHVLRHLHASLVLAQGVAVPAVSRRLGHANLGITMSVYAHALENEEGEVVEAIAWVLASAQQLGQHTAEGGRPLACSSGVIGACTTSPGPGRTRAMRRKALYLGSPIGIGLTGAVDIEAVARTQWTRSRVSPPSDPASVGGGLHRPAKQLPVAHPCATRPCLNGAGLPQPAIEVRQHRLIFAAKQNRVRAH